MTAIALGAAAADPADDALARVQELSRQALAGREAVTAAQRELDAKHAEQAAAEERHRADLATLEAVNDQLAPHQAAVDRLAATIYMSGRTGAGAAVLTAASPQQLIDKLAIQRVVTDRMADQLRGYREAKARATAAARASEASAAAARAAAEQAAAQQAELNAKWQELLRQIAAAEAEYAALSPQQQAMLEGAPPPEAPPAPDPAVVALPGPPPDEAPAPVPVRIDVVPEALPVGVAVETGLKPNTILVARAISARFPEIRQIGGVRPDSKPWHPNGLAIDVMIPNHSSPEGIALGDEIRDYVLANAARFGVQDVIWRGTYYTPAGPAGSGYGHFDHVHVTTLPSR